MTIKLVSVRDITGGVGISYKSSQILTPSVAICVEAHGVRMWIRGDTKLRR